MDKASNDFKLYLGDSFSHFINSSDALDLKSDLNDDDDDIFNQMTSKYYSIHEFNKIKHDFQSSLGLLHTNLASIYNHYDDLSTSLSKLKFNFDMIAITEHKIKNDSPYQNIELPGYHEFIFDPTLTSHGGTGFYVKESLTYKMRNDLKLKSLGPGDFESTFIEIILPGGKYLIVGCIYRHPSSSLTIVQFIDEYIEPLL